MKNRLQLLFMFILLKIKNSSGDTIPNKYKREIFEYIVKMHKKYLIIIQLHSAFLKV